MTQISLFRLYALRAAYLLIVVGLGIQVWPGIIHHDQPWELMEGVVTCVLAAVSILALIGLRYPVRMLPLLIFELIWKSLWLGLVALPMYRADQMDAGTAATTFACLLGAIFLIVIPWPYVMRNFVMVPGDRWR
jgi:hypothetical protein